jgi:hypothetical protein
MLRAPTRTRSGPGSKHPSERSECRPCRQRLAPVHGLLVVLSGPADAMICTAAASQRRGEYQTKKQRHSARPVSHARSETRGQLPRHRYLLRKRCSSSFPFSRRASMHRGTTSCELKRAWGVSEHSERFPAQAKWLRSNTHRDEVREQTEETDGRPCSQRDLLGIVRGALVGRIVITVRLPGGLLRPSRAASIWPTRVNIQREAFQV